LSVTTDRCFRIIVMQIDITILTNGCLLCLGYINAANTCIKNDEIS